MALVASAMWQEVSSLKDSGASTVAHLFCVDDRPRARASPRLFVSMRRLKRVLLAAAFIAFTTIGAVMLFVGQGRDRVWGFACVLFFGFGGLAYFLLPALTRRGVGVEQREIEHRGVRQPAIVFFQSRAKIRVAVVGCVAFSLAGVLLILVDEAVIGWITAVFFGAFAALGSTRAFGGAMYVALLRNGILHRAAGTAFVPWEAITEVAVMEINDAKFVGVRADPAAIDTSTALQLGIMAGRAVAGVEMSFSSLVASEEELCRAIEHFLNTPPRGRGSATRRNCLRSVALAADLRDDVVAGVGTAARTHRRTPFSPVARPPARSSTSFDRHELREDAESCAR